MSIKIFFDCEFCGKSLSVNAKYAGRRGKCKGCGNSLEVPEIPAGSRGQSIEVVGPPDSSERPDLKSITRDDVLEAMDEIDDGLEHHFATSKKYALVFVRQRYSPKAVVGVAYKVATGRLLAPSDFSGGNEAGQANYVLRKLGFDVLLIDELEENGSEPVGQEPASESDVVLDYLTNNPFQTLDEISQATWIAETTIKGILENELSDSVGKTFDCKWGLHVDLDSYEPSKAEQVGLTQLETGLDSTFRPQHFEYFSLEEKLEHLRKIYRLAAFQHLCDLPLRALISPKDRHLPQVFLAKKVARLLELSVEEMRSVPGVGDTRIEKIIAVLLRAVEGADSSEPIQANSQGSGPEVPCLDPQSPFDLIGKLPLMPVSLGEISNSLSDIPANSYQLDTLSLMSMSEEELTSLPGIGASKASEIASEVDGIKLFLSSGYDDGEFCLVLARREIYDIEDWCFEIFESKVAPQFSDFRLKFVVPVLRMIHRDFDKEMRQIVQSRIGFNTSAKTLNEIADDYGVTRERIRQKLGKVADAIKLRFPKGSTLLLMIANLTEHNINCAEVNQLVRECRATFFSTEKADQSDRPSAKEVLGAWAKLGREHSTPFSHAQLIQWISDQFPGIVDSFAFDLIASDALVAQCPNGKTIFLTNRVEDRSYAYMLNATGRVTLEDLSEELEANDRSLKTALASDQRIAMDDDQNLVLLEDIGFKRHDGKWFLNLQPIQDSPDLDNEVIIPVETIVNCVLNGMSGKGIVDASVWGVYRFVNELLEYEYRCTFPLGVDEIILADVLVAHSDEKITNMRRRRLRWDDPEAPTAIGKKGWIAKVVNQADFAITVDELDEELREFYQDYAGYVLDQLESNDDEDGDETAAFEVVKLARSGLPLIVSPSNAKFDDRKEAASLLVESALAGLTDEEKARVIALENRWVNSIVLKANASKSVNAEAGLLKDAGGIPESYVSLVEAVVTILSNQGEPMHIGKIRDELVSMGVPIPGQGKDANIIVYIRKSKDFCRTAVGTYALTIWGIPTIDKPKTGWKRDSEKPAKSIGQYRPEGVRKLLNVVAEPNRPMQIYEAAFKVLHEFSEPTHISKIREQIESKGYFQFGAQDPEGALRVAIDRHANNVEISRPAEPTVFYRHAPAIYGLLEWKNQTVEQVPASDPQSIIASMEAETWFALSRWAKVNDRLEPKERSLAYSVGKVLNNGNMPSPKQAKWAVDILGRAKADGFDPNEVKPKTSDPYKPPKSNLRTDTVNDVLASFILGE